MIDRSMHRYRFWTYWFAGDVWPNDTMLIFGGTKSERVFDAGGAKKIEWKPVT